MNVLSKLNQAIISSLVLLISTTAIFANEETVAKAIPVTTVKVVQMPMIETTLARGEIESPNTPYVAAKVAAEVVSIKVDDGTAVKAGQLLARLDEEAFRIAEQRATADMQRLEAMVENQQRKVERSKQLFNQKLISSSLHEDVLSVMKQLQAELLSARSMLRQAQYQLSHTKVISPVNGIVQQRMVSKGDYVKIGVSMFQIVSTDEVRARVYFPDTLGSSVHVGMKVMLTKRKQTVTGVISSIRPMMENSNRSLHALVEFNNSNNWRAGTSVVAKTVLTENSSAIAVPQRTLVQRPAGTVVYKIRGNKVTEKIVSTGMQQDDFIEITSGLKDGETIVMDGASWLTDGAIIDIQKGNTNK